MVGEGDGLEEEVIDGLSVGLELEGGGVITGIVSVAAEHPANNNIAKPVIISQNCPNLNNKPFIVLSLSVNMVYDLLRSRCWRW